MHPLGARVQRDPVRGPACCISNLLDVISSSILHFLHRFWRTPGPPDGSVALCLGAPPCVPGSVLQLDSASPAPLISPLNDPLIASEQSFEINQALEVPEHTYYGSSVRPEGRAFISILSVTC